MLATADELWTNLSATFSDGLIHMDILDMADQKIFIFTSLI